MRYILFRRFQNAPARAGKNDCHTITRKWHDLFDAERESLSQVANILVDEHCSPAGVLLKAESRLKDRHVSDEFLYRCAIRAVVVEALDMRPEVPAVDQVRCECEAAKSDQFQECIASLPIHERRAVLLRDFLGYARRDIALLLNLSDSRVDELLSFGRRLLSGLETPMKMQIAWSHGH